MPLFPPQDYRKTEFTHRRGLAANRPAAGDVLIGTLYFSTDTLVLERSTGTVWESYSGGGGSPGAQGSMGPMGLDGQQGEQGEFFPIPGPPGTIGATGSQGPQGIQGFPGLDGQDGVDSNIPGPTGPAGPAGNTGPQGLQGLQGLQGPPGLDGEDAIEPLMIPGPQGPQGPAGGGGGSFTVTQMEANLGSTPAWRGTFTITDAGISGTSKVLVWQAPGPYTGKGTRADECEMDWIQCHTIPGSGSATVHWRSVQGFSGDSGQLNMRAGRAFVIGKVRGNVKFHYAIG